MKTGIDERRLFRFAITGLLILLLPLVSLGEEPQAESPEVLEVRGSRARYAEVESTVPAFSVDAW